jgi:HAMP domain-containing protein
MKIRSKIFFSFLIPGIILAVVGIGIFYYISANNLKKQIDNHLETTVQSREHHLKNFLLTHRNIAEIIGEGITFKDLLKTQKTDSLYKQKFDRAQKRLKNIADVDKTIISICVINTKGIVIASPDGACLGKDRSASDIFIEGLKDFYIKEPHFSEFKNNKIFFSISVPVKEKNDLLGVVVVNIDPDELFNIMEDRAGLGETGEIYLVNEDGYMITPSRFIENAVLRQKVDTNNLRDCFSGKESLEHAELEHKVIDVFEDYRGVRALGVHAHIPEIKWCLLAEIDEKEALEPINSLLFANGVIGLITILFVLFLAWFVGRFISNPIKKLQEGVEIISQGNLDYKIGSDSQDEVGQLSRAFDNMTKKIKQSRKEIDKRVKEQTQKIKQQQAETEKAKENAERINKTMVGREMKMIELKDEIKRLKNKK